MCLTTSEYSLKNNKSKYIWIYLIWYSDVFRYIQMCLNTVWILINLNTSEYIWSEYSDVFRFIRMCLNTSEYSLNLNKSKYIWINLIFLVQIFLDLFRFIQTRSKSWRLNNFFQTYSDQIQTYSDRFLGKGEIKIYSDQFRCHFPLVLHSTVTKIHRLSRTKIVIPKKLK